MWLSEREKWHKFKCLPKRFLEILGHIDERGMGRSDTYRTYRKQKKKNEKGKNLVTYLTRLLENMSELGVVKWDTLLRVTKDSNLCRVTTAQVPMWHST